MSIQGEAYEIPKNTAEVITAKTASSKVRLQKGGNCDHGWVLFGNTRVTRGTGQRRLSL